MHSTTTATHTVRNTEPMSIAKLTQALEHISGMLGLPSFNAFVDLQVQINALATKSEPARKHKRRSNQTRAYHLRIQKKWLKRYGEKSVPAAYVIDNAFLGGFGHTVVAHPSFMRVLKP